MPKGQVNIIPTGVGGWAHFSSLKCMRENANSVSGIRVRKVAEKHSSPRRAKGPLKGQTFPGPRKFYSRNSPDLPQQWSEELHGLTCLVYLDDMASGDSRNATLWHLPS